MNYAIGAAALIGLCLSGVLLLATLSWMVSHAHARLTVAWLVALASLVVLQSLEFLYHAADLFLQWPFFLKLVDPLIVLLPFTLYGYIRALQGDNFLQQRSTRLLHLSPALIVAALDVPYWSMPAAEKIDWMLRMRINEHEWQPLAPYGNAYLAIFAVLSLIYWWLQRRQGYQGRRTRTSQWIDTLQGIYLIVSLSLFARIALSLSIDLNLSVAYTLAPISAYILYLFLVQAQLPQAPPARPALRTSAATSPASAGHTEEASNDATAEDDSEQDQGLQALFRELEQALSAGAFRDNELSLGKLAAHCGMTTHQASAAINQCSGSNFYDWLNQYRIQAARQALRNSDTPVSRICFDVGFNSKSTFNTAFRRISGCTPTEYRKRSD